MNECKSMEINFAQPNYGKVTIEKAVVDTKDGDFSFNFMHGSGKYRVTIEQIEEPPETIMWDYGL